MRLNRKHVIVVTCVLILLWLVTPVLTLKSSSANIQFSGLIIENGSTFQTFSVNFEAPEDFLWNEDWQRTDVTWNASSGGAAIAAGYSLFEPSTDIVHSGGQSAELVLLQPNTDTGRRLHFEHLWAPNNRNFWTVAWYYLPTDFVGVDADWQEILRCATTYMHVKDTPWGSAGDEWWKESLHIMPYNDRFQIFAAIGQGFVDNNNDGVNDYSSTTFENCPKVYSIDTIGKGEWNKLETYVYRDKAHGIFQFWLNGVLQWDEREIDTLGISFERMRYAYEHPEIYTSAKVTNGISLYTGVGGAPKTVYFDDVVISNSTKIDH